MAETCLSIRFCTVAEEEVGCYPRRKKPKAVYKRRDEHYMIQNGKKYKLSCRFVRNKRHFQEYLRATVRKNRSKS